jgi:Holliday junction resolvase RusA-like endonuclease
MTLAQTISVKPLSVNECWKGKRFKTPAYTSYEKEVLYLLKSGKVPPAPFELHICFGVSNVLSDWDNPVKPFQDILQKKYGFNDKSVMRAVVQKDVVKKGKEYISFELKTLTSAG